MADPCGTEPPEDEKYQWKVIASRGSAYPLVGESCGVICVVTVVKDETEVLLVFPPMSVPSMYHWIVFPVGKVLAGTVRLCVFPDTLIWLYGSEVELLQYSFALLWP